MSYSTEHIAQALKAARKQKGLSQRALSALAGIPQSHISKIEADNVDLRMSSLASIAHALDLELVLVPRKAVPAVQSISRSATKAQTQNPLASKELARTLQAVSRIPDHLKTAPEFTQLRTQLEQISTSQMQLRDTDALRHVRKSIEAIHDSRESAQSLQEALKAALQSATSLRDTLVRAGVVPEDPSPARRAYRLGDEDDG